MRIGFYRIALVACLVSMPLVVYGQSQDPDAWGSWGSTDSPRDRPWEFCPDCGNPWGPYGGRGMDLGGEWNREQEPRIRAEDRGSGQAPRYDYGPRYPGYEYPAYENQQRRPLGGSRPGGTRSRR